MIKNCCICKHDLPLDRFKSNKTKKDGLQSQCISCQKQYRKEHYERNKAKYIKKAKERDHQIQNWWREYKKSLKCSRCSEDHPACLDFHHIDPLGKDNSVSRLIAMGNKRKILDEVKKCEVLCSNCHRKLHYSAGLVQ